MIPVAVTFTAFWALDGPVLNQHLPFNLPTKMGESQSHTYRISTSITQTVYITAPGLLPATIDIGEVTNETNALFNFHVPKDTVYAALALFSADYPEGLDLDLSLFRKVCNSACNDTDTDFLDLSWKYGSTEFLDTSNGIVPGDYVVSVEAYKPPEGFKSPVYLYSWTIIENNSGTNLMPGTLAVTPDHLDMSASDPCCCQVTATVSGLNTTADPVPNR